MERSAQEIREEMAKILRVPVSDDIENVDEHELQYGLEDSDLDRFQELRTELEEAIRAGRLEPQTNDGQDENQPEPEPEPAPKTPEQLAQEKFDNITTLINNIRNADEISNERQNEIDRKREELRNETRPVVVEELREEVANLEKDKGEFDEMTRVALENARKEATQIQQESEKAFNDKLVEFMNRKNDIERKLKAMRERDLTPEKLAMAERSAQKAMDDLNREMSDYQAAHFEKRSKLDEYIKYIENSINVTYADVKYEASEHDDNGQGKDGDNGQGKDGDDGQGKDGDNGQGKDGDNGQGKDGDDGQGKDGDNGQGKDGDNGQGKDGDNGQGKDGDNGQGKDGDDGQGKDGDNGKGKDGDDGQGKDGDNGQGKDGDDGQGKDGDDGQGKDGDDGQGKDGDDGQGKDGDNGKGKEPPVYRVGKIRGFFLKIVQAILKKVKPDGAMSKFFGGIESTLLLGAQETLPIGKPEPTKVPEPEKPVQTEEPQKPKKENIEFLPGVDDVEWARDQVNSLDKMDKNSLMWKIIEGEYRQLLEDRKDKSDEDLQKIIEEEEVPQIAPEKGKDGAFQNLLYYRISLKALKMAIEKGIALKDDKGDRVIDDIYADLERKYLQEKTNEASRQAAENQQQGDGQKPKEPKGKEAPDADQEK